MLEIKTVWAGPPNIQPQINSLVIGQQYNYAIKVIEKEKKAYGPKNDLLFLMDYGVVLQMAKQYEKSISVFEEAKKKFDQYFTVSLTNAASTWLVNDYNAPYRGEDFERVMINIFQAINFCVLGKFDEALVEARDVDNKLRLINQQYQPSQQNVYKEDAFARFLMGMLYESNGGFANINDAYISYKNAVEAYEQLSGKDTDFKIPDILKQNILAAAKVMGSEEFAMISNKFQGVDFMPLEQKAQRGEVIVIHYFGLSPIKHQIPIPIPLPGGIVGKLAFPYYDKRGLIEKRESILKAERKGDQPIFSSDQLVEDIGAIAIQNLNNRKARVIAKAILRPVGKYIAEEAVKNQIDAKWGRTSGEVFGYLSSIYNLASEQADLRSWQTLPDKIYISRLILQPGDYQISFDGKSLGNVVLASGEKRFFVVRSTR